MHKKTVKDIDVAGKTVLVRADYNVPILENGEVGDKYRIEQSLPTLLYLLKNDCKVVIISHLGRPDGKPDKKYSLKPIAKVLSELLNLPVEFVPDCIGEQVKETVSQMKSGKVVLLENPRFYPEEEANDDEFAKKLASIADVFVQDCFGVAHRTHASIVGVTKHLPSVAGFLIEKEVTTITEAMENPKRPLVAIVGGAKISDKIELLEKFIDKADHTLIGGAMANTFLKTMGYKIGKSVFEEGQDAEVERIFKLANKKDGTDQYISKAEASRGANKVTQTIALPDQDVAVAKAIDESERRQEVETSNVAEDEYILDIGSKSAAEFIDLIKQAATVIWNGPVGMTELPNFAHSSNYIAAAIKDSNATSIIGGGDTAAFIMDWDPAKGKSFTHVSTGGGASLELMAGKKLPGVEALLDK